MEATFPEILIVPEFGSYMLDMIDNRVLFPAPLRPMIPKTVPLEILKEMFDRTIFFLARIVGYKLISNLGAGKYFVMFFSSTEAFFMAITVSPQILFLIF